MREILRGVDAATTAKLRCRVDARCPAFAALGFGDRTYGFRVPAALGARSTTGRRREIGLASVGRVTVAVVEQPEAAFDLAASS